MAGRMKTAPPLKRTKKMWPVAKVHWGRFRQRLPGIYVVRLSRGYSYHPYLGMRVRTVAFGATETQGKRPAFYIPRRRIANNKMQRIRIRIGCS